MELTPLTAFDNSKEPERLRQTVGCLIAPDHYYAAVRPEGAQPNDGEDKLLIRDDAFGEGILQTELDMEWPRAMLNGADLADPVDAVMLTSNGFVLMLRGGQMRIEEIAEVGGDYDTPERYGMALGMGICRGKLHVAASDGRVFVRHGPSDWERLCEERNGPLLSTVAMDGDGGIVAAGEQDYDPAVVLIDPAGVVRRELWQGAPIRAAATSPDGDVWLCGWSGFLRRGRVATGFTELSVPPENFSGLAHVGNRVLLIGSGSDVWSWRDGHLASETVDPKNNFVVYSLENGPAGLVAQGDNGFAIFDGESWHRIGVPW